MVRPSPLSTLAFSVAALALIKADSCFGGGTGQEASDPHCMPQAVSVTVTAGRCAAIELCTGSDPAASDTLLNPVDHDVRLADVRFIPEKAAMFLGLEVRAAGTSSASNGLGLLAGTKIVAVCASDRAESGRFGLDRISYARRTGANAGKASPLAISATVLARSDWGTELRVDGEGEFFFDEPLRLKLDLVGDAPERLEHVVQVETVGADDTRRLLHRQPAQLSDGRFEIPPVGGGDLEIRLVSTSFNDHADFRTAAIRVEVSAMLPFARFSVTPSRVPYQAGSQPEVTLNASRTRWAGPEMPCPDGMTTRSWKWDVVRTKDGGAGENAPAGTVQCGPAALSTGQCSLRPWAPGDYRIRLSVSERPYDESSGTCGDLVTHMSRDKVVVVY